jgi:hypothetical protein
MGVRTIVSTWAFLQGLLDTGKPATLQCLDLDEIPGITPICNQVKQYGIEMTFVKGDSATTPIKPVDLLFIDTWHVYGHLKRELAFHCGNVSKYIIMHDTTVDGIYGESIRFNNNTRDEAKRSGYPEEEIRKGLMPAITEFLAAHPEWRLKEKFTNNNGLTVLQKN